MVREFEGGEPGLSAEQVDLVVGAAAHPDPADVPRAERPDQPGGPTIAKPPAPPMSLPRCSTDRLRWASRLVSVLMP
jgi:hypothetical protein